MEREGSLLCNNYFMFVYEHSVHSVGEISSY